MNAEHYNPFLEPYTMPQGLFERVIECISKEDFCATRRHAALSFFFACLSLGALGTAGVWVWRDMVNNGFVGSLSLAFSDSSVVLSYWQDFSALLLETLPIVSLMLCFAALGGVIISLGYLHRYKNFYTHNYVNYFRYINKNI